MITPLASFVCLVLAQTPTPKQLLYKVEIIDSNGSLTKPVVRTLENEAAEIKMSCSGREIKIKLVPGKVEGQQVNTSSEIKLSTSLFDNNGKTTSTHEQTISTVTKLTLGKTSVWDVSDKSVTLVKMPKSHRAPKNEILISIEIEVPNGSP